MNKNKKSKPKGKSLAQKLADKRRHKADKLGKFLYKCVGAAHQLEGCGNEWTSDVTRGHPEECPRCGNKYYQWINYVST